MHITVVDGNLGVFLPEGHNLFSEQLVVVRGDFVEFSQTAIAIICIWRPRVQSEQSRYATKRWQIHHQNLIHLLYQQVLRSQCNQSLRQNE